LKISRNKTEYYIKYTLVIRDQEVEGMRRPKTIGGDVKGEIDSFKYLGSFVQKNGAVAWMQNIRLSAGG